MQLAKVEPSCSPEKEKEGLEPKGDDRTSELVQSELRCQPGGGRFVSFVAVPFVS